MTDIPGATSSTYTLVTADLGQNITCKVTASNSAGSANANAAQIGPVTSTTNVWNFLKLGKRWPEVTHIDLASDGTMVGTTDSFGAYVWPPAATAWTQLLEHQYYFQA